MLHDSPALIRAHRRNIERYRRLLRTHLTDVEVQYIDRRIRQEQASLDALAIDNFPLRLPHAERWLESFK